MMSVWKCRICNNESAGNSFIVKEMMFGTHEKFTYFQWSECGCLQIADISADMTNYYPANYYSYQLDWRELRIHKNTVYLLP